MKKLILLFALISFNSYSQKLPIKVELRKTIEINGHVFDNSKFERKIIVSFDLYNNQIAEGETTYTRRNCGDDKCEILHLEELNNYNPISHHLYNIPPNILLTK